MLALMLSMGFLCFIPASCRCFSFWFFSIFCFILLAVVQRLRQRPPIPAPHPLQVVDKVAETCIINLCPSGRTSRSSSPFLLQQLIEEKDSPEVTLAHPKAKEWIVSMAKANYQELAKMASEYPELVKLQVSLTDSAFLSHF